MGNDVKRTTSSLWLTVALASSCAVLGYRLAAGILTLLGPWLEVPRAELISPREPRGPLFDLIGTGAGVVLAIVVSRSLRKSSFRANAIAFSLFTILAVLPLRVHVREEFVVFAPPGAPVPAQVKPMTLKMKLLEGEHIGSDVIIDESNVEYASVAMDPYGTYSVALKLDSEGRDIIARTTETEIGKRLAVFVDGELICSPEITAPIESRQIGIPGHFTRREAERIAAGIEAARKKLSGGE